MPKDDQISGAVPTLQASEKKSALGFDLKSAIANAARTSLAEQLPATKVPTGEPGRSDHDRKAEGPRSGRDQQWAPPGNIASAEKTHQAIHSARTRLADLSRGVNANASTIYSDQQAVRNDLAAALRGRGRRQELEIIARGRVNEVGHRPATELALRDAQDRQDVLHPEGTKTANPLVVQQRAVAEQLRVTPDWHSVVNLPGYQTQATRIVSRAAFDSASNSSLESMHMICELLNPAAHVQAVAQWVMKNATEVDASTLDFNTTFPGLKADYKVFQDSTSTYIVTRDVGGHYVYVRAGGLPETPSLAKEPQVRELNPPVQSRRRGPGVEM